MQIAEYLHTQTNIPIKTLEKLVNHLFERQEVKKYDMLLKAGNQRLLRCFYEKNKKDITHNFFVDETFYFPVENIYFSQSSPYFLEALEDGVIWVASFREVEQIVDEHQELERLMRFLLVSGIKSLSERLYTLKFQTAQERYDLLMQNYPQILLRAPLGHIASLLGITQQTLSVTRSKK